MSLRHGLRGRLLDRAASALFGAARVGKRPPWVNAAEGPGTPLPATAHEHHHRQPQRAVTGYSRANEGTDGTREEDGAYYKYEDPAPITPWVRRVITGIELLRNGRYNKGMAFSEEERHKMHLLGLLPPGKFTQNTQVKRVMRVIRGLSDPTEQHLHLLGLLERNERLFYRVLVEHHEELFPIMYTPTVGKVCKKFSEVFFQPRALYITSADKGRIYDILKNWPEKHLKLLVVTDGERVMGLGDLGVQGIGVAVAKSCLYTSMGGMDPADVLPVCIDVGTNNQTLLNDPLYIGQRCARMPFGEEYDELMDEFVDAVKRRFGDRVIVQFEDFSNQNGKRLQERYATRAATFNDDISGVAATTLAGIIASLPKTGMKKVGDHTFLVAGAGETGTGIGEMIAEYIAQDEQIPINEARKRIWMVDSKGLITRRRAEKEEDLAFHKLPWAHDGMDECATVQEAVEAVRPTALIGVRRHKHSLTSGALAGDSHVGVDSPNPAGGVDALAESHPPRLFTKAVLQKMGECASAPLIFALSRPEGIAECTAEEAYDATGGRCVFAGGCPVPPFVHGGRGVEVRQSTSAYVFPGFAYGLTLADAHRVRTPMWLEAAEAVADSVTEEDLAKGAVYPRMSRIREVSARVAARVAMKCHEMGVASIPGKPPSSAKMLADARRKMYNPAYRCYM